MNATNLSYEILKISLIALTAYISHYYYKYFTRVNPLPGPFPLPIIGNIHQVFKKLHLDVGEIQAKYGDLCEFYIGSRRHILLGNDALIQKTMKPVINGPFQNRVEDDHEGLKELGLLNVGLFFNNNYNEWQYHRKFFTKVIMAPSFIKQSVKVVQDNFSVMEKFWEKLGEDTVLEFNYWMKYYFFDTIFITVTSKPAYALANYYSKLTPSEKSTLPESIFKECDMFIESIEAHTSCMAHFLFVPKIIRNFPIIKKYTQRIQDKFNWLKNNLLNIIVSRREEISKTSIDQRLKPDMLTMFLTVNTEKDVTTGIADDLHDKPMSDEEALSNFIEVMGGGIDSSSNFMCFIVYFLKNNPKAKQRMVEEIERVLGKDTNYLLTSEDLLKLEYVEAVIYEVSRLCTLSPVQIKHNSSPEDIGGYIWPKNTNFILNLVGSQTHKSYWEDPDIFNPDRFMENPRSKNKIYLFGGGVRICPGRNLAMMELKATLVMLYRKYDIELLGPIKERITTLRGCTELKVKLRKRKFIY